MALQPVALPDLMIPSVSHPKVLAQAHPQSLEKLLIGVLCLEESMVMVTHH